MPLLTDGIACAYAAYNRIPSQLHLKAQKVKFDMKKRGTAKKRCEESARGAPSTTRGKVKLNDARAFKPSKKHAGEAGDLLAAKVAPTSLSDSDQVSFQGASSPRAESVNAAMPGETQHSPQGCTKEDEGDEESGEERGKVTCEESGEDSRRESREGSDDERENTRKMLMTLNKGELVEAVLACWGL